MIGFGQCTVTSIDESSPGACDGIISIINVSGCIPPYVYVWNNGQTTPTISGLCAGTYSFAIIDSNGDTCCSNITTISPAGIAGCTDSLALNYDPTATIDDSSCVYCNLTATISTTDVSCNGLCDGTATAIVSGGTLPFQFQWYDLSVQPWLLMSQNQTLTGLCADSTFFVSPDYVMISDANGCTFTQNLSITEPLPLISYDTLSVTTSLTWNNMTLTVSGDYSITLINSVGCDSIANLNLTVTTTGISDIANTKSNLVKITDMLGQETPYRRNTPLFYIYDDGTVEKRIVIE